MRKIKNFGNFENAIKMLKSDKNNSVALLLDNLEIQENPSHPLNKTIATIKDNYAMKNLETKGSSKILETFNPGYDAHIVEKLKKAGVNIVGKVHMDELALGGTGAHSAYGLIKNPFDNSRYVGGSSSGSASTLTEDITFSIGSDTGDSVRLPASFIGKVGFKPSYGAISRYGLFAYASSLDTVAYFAHNVNDIIIISESLYGKDNRDMTSIDVDIKNTKKIKPTKIIAFDFENDLSDYFTNSYKNLLKKLQDQNIEIELIKPDRKILRLIQPVYRIISFSEASSNLSNLNGIAFGSRSNGDSWDQIIKNTRSEKFGKMVQERLSLGSYFLYEENQQEIFIKAQKARRLIKNYYEELLNKADIILYPATHGIAPKFSDNSKHGVLDYILTGSNLIGSPSITIPLDKKESLSYSIALDSKIYSDKKLLGIAEYIEEVIKGGNSE
ncbi:amidase [Mycoplasmopsis canis PG 14]|uniref:Aspartyl/glutamyl-tRNA(Asn/Gln) amidotransferase subunit A n=1 Tax=Mycoplasmopsis canis TaxID=29555 RepID=A0A449AQF0_9BACT|nr:amidase family protein [Mycoplasmopsis canis]AMD81265.1 amidase [Mycoplasmopsis canis PG 14]EIE40594.1 amidase [Mycoplasmopsis canis PG 14]VEU68763.1 aspartyl/glutamyl-tRNA(Asn/Gln) amidotransferase subunit A [Mycoplasmopsis canis]